MCIFCFCKFFTEDTDSILFCDTSAASTRNSKRNTVCGNLLFESASVLQKDSFVVTSVPNDLDIFSTKCISNSCSETDDSWTSKNQRNIENHYWQDTAATHTVKGSESIANKNFDLAQTFREVDHSFIASPSAVQQTFQQQKLINSSYSNLTILDYSCGSYSARNSFGNQLRMMADKPKRNSVSSSNRSSASSTEFSKCNFLLDEISAHFDRSLSILNDKLNHDDETDSTATASSAPDPKQPVGQAPSLKPPQPPPRRQQPKKSPNSESQSKHGPKSMPGRSFDQDPTNLKTCYATSLEQCNFDLTESSNSIHLFEKSGSEQPRDFNSSKCSTPVKRELIASTPNLFQHRNGAASDENLHSSSAYNSLNPLPDGVQMKSILSGGSRSSLGKGVSFYPFVSEISWHEQSSVDTPEEHSDVEHRYINIIQFQFFVFC